METTIQQMTNEAIARESNLKNDFDEQLAKVNTEYINMKTSMEDARKETEEIHQTTISDMKADYESLTYRFETRESRPEDLERIAELERLINEANEKLGSQEERMRILKEEMRNREESYNVKFASDPKVMTTSDMSWMKSKNKLNTGRNQESTSSKRQPSARRASTLY